MTAITMDTTPDAERNEDDGRIRIVTWADQAATSSVAGTIPGIEFLERIARGELPPPPMASLMNFGLAEIEKGRIVFTVVPAEYHYNPIGIVHGGLAATLLDSAMGCAVHSMLPAGVGYTTLDLQVRFVRAVTVATGPLRCEARVVHSGSRLMTTEGHLRDEKGVLYAHGTGSCLILERREPKPAAKANG